MDLYSYACKGDVQGLHDLFSKTQFSQNQKNTALQMAAELGKLHSVKFLISQGANIFSDQEYAMYLACKNNQNDVILYLLSLGSFPVKI